MDPETHESDRESCRRYKLTEAEVRKMFRTYHEVKVGEMHDNYLEVPCGIEGTVEVHGKTYTWKTQLGGTMTTTWPDGILKILGGPPTEDLSEGERRPK